MLDRLPEPIDIARQRFSTKGLDADFLVDDIANIEGNWDGIWNTGVLQCYQQAEQSALIEKLCGLALCILVVYPDITHPGFPQAFDPDAPPGISGCVQYPTDQVPEHVARHCSEVHHGIIPPEASGLGYPFEYVWGSRS